MKNLHHVCCLHANGELVQSKSMTQTPMVLTVFIHDLRSSVTRQYQLFGNVWRCHFKKLLVKCMLHHCRTIEIEGYRMIE